MPFDWCARDQHEDCRRKYQRFVIEPNKKRGQPSTKLVWLDEWNECDCTKRSCECYKQRQGKEPEPKKKQTRRKRKS